MGRTVDLCRARHMEMIISMLLVLGYSTGIVMYSKQTVFNLQDLIYIYFLGMG